MSHCSGYSDPSSFAEDGMSFKFKFAPLDKMFQVEEFLYLRYTIVPCLFFFYIIMAGLYYFLGPEVLDEEGTQEDLEYKLKGLIDLTLDKR